MSKRSKSLPPSVMSVEVVEEIFEQLKGLSPREQAIIRPVLERDLEFQRREKARVRQLKSMVDMHLIDQGQPPPMSARRKSAYGLMNSMSSDSMLSVCSLRSNKPALPRPVPEPPSGRVCFHCHTRLGILFNAGTRCSKCGRLLCGDCRRGTARSKWLCQSCYAQRELKAASGEWVEGGDPAEISEVLLAQMRRAAMEKEKQEEKCTDTDQPRTPMVSKRNLTLPTIATPSLLAVPSESEIADNNKQAASQKFWGGSPSPRSPHQNLPGSPNYVRVTESSPSPSRLNPGTHGSRETIGSPSPRHTPSFTLPSSPTGRIGVLPITEVAPPTPTTPGQIRSPLSETRRLAFANSKSSGSRTTSDNNEKYLQPVDKRLQRGPPTDSMEELDQRPREPRTGTLPSPQSYRAHPSGNAQGAKMRNDKVTNLHATGAPNPDMRQHAQMRPTSKDRLCANRTTGRTSAAGEYEAVEPSSPVCDNAVRRQRLPSQGPVTVRKVKAQASDRLDVSGRESRRSSGISLQSRSGSQDGRMYKVDHVTPASSRDSLSVTSFATEVSGDVCTRSSVASQATCEKTTFLGEIQLILSYDIRSACFCVHVIQCRSLPHFGSHRPNPYVKVLLVPRDSSATVLKNKTTPRKADADPVFDQILKFPRITKSELEQYQLVVSVWHKDLLTQNAPIAEAAISLRDYDWDTTCPVWYQLEGKTVASTNGSMSMENGDSPRSHSPDVLTVGSGTTDRSSVTASTRRTVFRNTSTSSSASSRNSRGVRKQESGGPITEKSRASKSLFKVVRALRFVIASKQRNPNSRLKKAVLQRKADGAEEERDSSKGTGGKSVELEHDIPKPESKRPPSKESEVEDQATDWTIWV
ncbi:hypothetical protein RB195_006594 [Necator americanus]